MRSAFLMSFTTGVIMLCFFVRVSLAQHLDYKFKILLFYYHRFAMTSATMTSISDWHMPSARHANIASATQIFGTLAGLRLSTLPTNVGQLPELRHSRQTVVCLGVLDNSIFCRVRLPTAVLSDSINDAS